MVCDPKFPPALTALGQRASLPDDSHGIPRRSRLGLHARRIRHRHGGEPLRLRECAVGPIRMHRILRISPACGIRQLGRGARTQRLRRGRLMAEDHGRADDNRAHTVAGRHEPERHARVDTAESHGLAETHQQGVDAPCCRGSTEHLRLRHCDANAGKSWHGADCRAQMQFGHRRISRVCECH